MQAKEVDFDTELKKTFKPYPEKRDSVEQGREKSKKSSN